MRALFSCLVIAALALAAVTAAQAAPGAVLVARADGVPLYAEASPTAPLLMSLEQGQRLLEFRRRGAWVEVAVFGLVGVRGWLREEEVVAEQRPAVTPPSPEDTAVAASPLFTLEIAGTPALAFRATCRLVVADGAEHAVTRAGLVPDLFDAEATAIYCRVRKTDADGRLRVRLLDDQTVLATAETRAAYNWVSVRSDGPWGAAAGLRGSVGLVVPRAPEPPPQGQPIDSLPRPLPRGKAPFR